MMRALALAVSLLFATGASTDGGVVSLAVSTKKNIMELRVGGKAIRTYDISVGKKPHRTPHGTFTINHIVWNPGWVPPKEKWAKGKKAEKPGSKKNPMKIVKIFFKEPDYYIHGTIHEDSLGAAASHGCIRMSQRDAFALGKYLMDKGGAGKDAAWYERVLSRGVPADVRLPRSVKVVIGP